MTTDMLIYAVLALLILARLWTVLGRRNEGDRERPNPFEMPPLPHEAAGLAPGVTEGIARALPSPVLAPHSLAGELAQLKTLDPAFDERDFLRQAKEDFTAIVGDFAQGDLTRSADKLGDQVKQNFENAIAARRASGQSLENKIARISDAETDAVHIDGTRAVITVHFVSEQENILRDAAGRVAGGQPGKLEEIGDLWSFGRDAAIPGSPWLLVETKS